MHRDPHSRKRQPRVTGRLQTNNSRPILFTAQDYSTAISDNQELKLVLSMVSETFVRNRMLLMPFSSTDDLQQEQTLDRLLNQFSSVLAQKENPIGKSRLERSSKRLTLMRPSRTVRTRTSDCLGRRSRRRRRSNYRSWLGHTHHLESDVRLSMSPRVYTIHNCVLV